MNPLSLSEALEYFLLARRHLAPNTVKLYKILLGRLVSHMDGLGVSSPNIGQLTELDLLRYADTLYSAGYKTATIAGHIRSIQTFFRWLHRKGLIAANPAADLTPPRIVYDRPARISLDDFLRVLTYAHNRRQQRDVAILVFLYGTGCRVAGLASLTLDRLDLANRTAEVIEKGNRARVVFLHDVVIVALGDYLAHHRPLTDSDRVFIGERGPLESSAITSIIIRLGKKAGVEGPCHPHAFRHAYSIEMMKGGAPLAAVSQLLGHADPVITAKYYARFGASALREIHEAHNPLNRLLLLKNR